MNTCFQKILLFHCVQHKRESFSNYINTNMKALSNPLRTTVQNTKKKHLLKLFLTLENIILLLTRTLHCNVRDCDKSKEINICHKNKKSKEKSFSFLFAQKSSNERTQMNPHLSHPTHQNPHQK